MAKMPNEGKSTGGRKGSGTNKGKTSGPRKSDENRSDVCTTPTHKNPYPRGLS